MKSFRLKSFFVFVFAVLIFASAEKAPGCSYLGYPQPPHNYIVAGTKTIFLGEVTAKTNFYQKTEGGKYWLQRVKFKVEKAFKGVSGETAEVIFAEKAKKRSSCDNEAPRPQIGEKWVVYDDYADENIMIYLRRDISLLSYKYSPEINAKHLLKLENLTSKPVTTIQGQVEFMNYESALAKNVEVVLEGSGVRRVTRTSDNWGEYAFENIPAGKYKVRFFLPYDAENLFPYPKQRASFDSETQKYYFEYEAAVSAGDSKYKYFLINKSAEPKKETSNDR